MSLKDLSKLRGDVTNQVPVNLRHRERIQRFPIQPSLGYGRRPLVRRRVQER